MKKYSFLDSVKSFRKPMPRPTCAVPMKKRAKLDKVAKKEMQKW